MNVPTHFTPAQGTQPTGGALGVDGPGFGRQHCLFPATWLVLSFPFLSLRGLRDGTRWSTSSVSQAQSPLFQCSLVS